VYPGIRVREMSNIFVRVLLTAYTSVTVIGLFWCALDVGPAV